MKKILFNDKFKLTEAVLSGRKTQTRRIITCPKRVKGQEVFGFYVQIRQSDGSIPFWPCTYDADETTIDGGEILPKYKVGEVVAVAQSYKDMGYSKYALDRAPKSMEIRGHMEESAGWNNKLFVRAEACRHQIRITNVRVERLNEISAEDCIAEGLLHSDKYAMPYGFSDSKAPNGVFFYYSTPREAYAALIDRISGRGTWESNPWVLAYDFELVK